MSEERFNEPYPTPETIDPAHLAEYDLVEMVQQKGFMQTYEHLLSLGERTTYRKYKAAYMRRRFHSTASDKHPAQTTPQVKPCREHQQDNGPDLQPNTPEASSEKPQDRSVKDLRQFESKPGGLRARLFHILRSISRSLHLSSSDRS